MVLDFQKYTEAVARMMKDPKMEGYDIYTMAAREVSGDPTLVLTKEQRNQCKMAAYGTIYSISGEAFAEALKRQGK